jgi:hypothetical protein
MGGTGCAGVDLTELSNATTAFSTAYLIQILYQNIVFEDSVLDGLEPGPLDNAGILLVANSTVSFVRLTVSSCTLRGALSSALTFGGDYHSEHEYLASVQDSIFMHNRGNPNQGFDGYLVKQSGGKLLIRNTQFISNTAKTGGQISSRSGGLTVDACTFRNNSGGASGCVYVFDTSAAVVDSAFEKNRVAAGSGGALKVCALSLQ